MIEKEDVFAYLNKEYRNVSIISTCGYMSRDLYNFSDSKNYFYMLGAMGMAAPVALGIALAKPEKKVIILDGDGSLLMSYGILKLIGHYKPKNLLHIVLDNEMYESTGGQECITLNNLCEIAAYNGYQSVLCVRNIDELPKQNSVQYPALIHIKTAPKKEKAGSRVAYTPEEIKHRFVSDLNNN